MLDAFLNVPAVVKVLAALMVILVVSRLSRHLIVAVLAATLLLALWSGYPAGAVLRIPVQRLLSPMCLLLMALVLQVIWLSSQMAAAGVMDDLVRSVRAHVSRHSAMAVLPAVIGLLPMPGGALFSAPLVDSVDVNGEVSSTLKLQTNHWFRHIWEYWWPLYPGVLLAAPMSGLEYWQFMLLQMPMTAFAVAVGSWFLLRRIGRGDGPAGSDAGHAPSFVTLVLPIIVVIGCYMAIRFGYALLSRAGVVSWKLNRNLPLLIGLLAAMLVLQAQRPLGWGKWREILFSRRAMVMVAIVAAVQVYGAFIQPDTAVDASLVEQMKGELTGWGIPLVPIIMLVPFISGLSTGLSMGFVAASFPIVMNLIGQDATMGVRLSTVTLAYGFGYMGMLISPVHVCLVVTSKYFETDMVRNIAALAKPGAVMLALITLSYYAVRAIFGV
ncbi:MAG: DUF401 family protein [Planctomycetes bacterium]|nr:DUF401 family protein [Planctomycetota bacterium]